MPYYGFPGQTAKQGFNVSRALQHRGFLQSASTHFDQLKNRSADNGLAVSSIHKLVDIWNRNYPQDSIVYNQQQHDKLAEKFDDSFGQDTLVTQRDLAKAIQDLTPTVPASKAENPAGLMKAPQNSTSLPKK